MQSTAPHHYTIGRDAALITRLSWVLPDRMLDRILVANLRPRNPKTTTAYVS